MVMNMSKFIGSTLLLIGTAIGAGMLALPMLSAAAGFFPAAILLVLVWALTTTTALLILEVNLAFKENENSFSSMAAATLGVAGKVVVWLTFLLLLYSLTAAYIAGNTSLLTTLFAKTLPWQIPSWLSALLFTLIFGGAVYWSTKTVDFLNRCLWSIKGLCLIATLILLLPHISIVDLLGQHHFIGSKYLLVAAPIFLCSFGFHTVIPSITSYVGRDIKQLKIIIILGTTITLIIYLLWLLVTLGALPAAQIGGSVGDFIATVGAIIKNKWVTMGIEGFANIAMTTSFLGVSLGLFDFLADGCKRKNTSSGRLQTALITFIPPLIFALYFPQGFILALGYAAIFVAVIIVIIPALMAWQLRRRAIRSPYRVFGGNFLLIIIVIVGIGFILLQILASMHLLPA
jgi:tyrosine-specific transport protein